jgi:hypothetical protein
VLVFAVVGKRKIGSLYQAPKVRSMSDFFQHITVWIAAMGEGCKIAAEGAAVGKKGFVIDCFELESVPKSLWEDYVPLLPERVVDEILADAQKYDGTITANVIHEDSIFALEEDERWEQGPASSQLEQTP